MDFYFRDSHPEREEGNCYGKTKCLCSVRSILNFVYSFFNFFIGKVSEHGSLFHGKIAKPYLTEILEYPLVLDLFAETSTTIETAFTLVSNPM